MYQVTVLSTKAHTDDLVTLRLSKPKDFTFIPGQFVVVQLTIQGKLVRRSYSIASGTSDDHLELLVRKQPHGLVSPVLCGLQTGDTLHILGPFGLFTLEHSELVCIGAGTGISPFLSLARSDASHRPIIYSARTPQELVYQEELGSLLETTITRPAGTGWQGRMGRIDTQLLKAHIDDASMYAICGPTPMVVAVTEALLSLGVSKERIITEKYGSIDA